MSEKPERWELPPEAAKAIADSLLKKRLQGSDSGGGPISLDQMFGLLSGDSELPAEEIEARARESVAKALEYFRSQGVDLGYVPTVKYTGESCVFCPSALAAVDAETEIYENILRHSGAAMFRAVFETGYGLKVSDAAISESMDALMKEIERMFPDRLFANTAEIILFKPSQKNLSRLDEFMVHEIWHLIEKKYGLLGQDRSLIHEGTATFVQTRFAGRKSEWTEESDYNKSVYQNGAFIVNEVVGEKETPLKAILEPATREHIRKEFDARVLPSLYGKFVKLVKSGATRGMDRRIVQTSEEYTDFRADPSKENLLKALRLRGYAKFAGELAGQDVSSLLNDYCEMLN